MLSNNELLEMYRMERKWLDDPLYGPAFPSFKQWRDEYVRQYQETHVTVSVDEADQMFENVITEAEQLIENVAELTITQPELSNDQKKVPLKRGRKPNPNKVPKKVAVFRAESKAAKAQQYYITNRNSLSRKKIIAHFINDIGLTASGAATYYQKFKSGAV